MEHIFDKISKISIFFISYTMLFFAFFSTINYTLPFVLSLISAFLLKRPTLALISKFKFKNTTASLISTFLFFALILSLLTLGITIIAQEAVQLTKMLQNYFSKNPTQIYDTFNDLKKYYDNLDPVIISTIENNFSSSISKISNITVAVTGKVISALIGFLASIPYILMVILFTLLATYFFTKDIVNLKNNFSTLIPADKADYLLFIVSETKKMFGRYLFSYFLIICLTFVETLIVFIIFKVKYAFLLSLLCAVADILPIIGIGAIYAPLALIYFFLVKNYITALGLVVSYFAVSIIRQVVEPKIVSSTLGIHPVAVLAALFIGLKASGLAGMIYCIFLVVFYTIFKKINLI